MIRRTYSTVRPILHQAIYVQRGRPAEAARALGMSSQTIWHHAKRLVAEFGPPPPCRCGRPGMHPGLCEGFNSEHNPKCPRCGSTSRKSGRSELADGWKEQRFRCRGCDYWFCRAPKILPQLADNEGKLYELIWVQGEKQTYAASVLGVHESTIQAWVRVMKARYGSPYLKGRGKAA